MKKYNSLRIAVLIASTIIFPTFGMENWMTQSTMESSEPVIPEKQKNKNLKTLPLQRNKKRRINFLQQNATQEKINSLTEQIKNIDIAKQEKYKSIIDDISLKLQTPKKLTKNKLNTIHYSLKIINGESVHNIIKEINEQPLGLKNKLTILIELYNLPQPVFYKESKVSRGQGVMVGKQNELKSWLTNKTKMAAEITKLEVEYNDRLISIKDKLQDEKIPLKDLRSYKTTLEASIAHLKNSTNPEEITKRNEYQELLATVSQQINLFTTIDTQLLIDYSNFTIKQLFDYLESLLLLRKDLQNVFSKRYETLNTRIEEVRSYLNLKRQQRDEQEKKIAERAKEIDDKLKAIDREKADREKEIKKESERIALVKQQDEDREKVIQQKIKEENDKEEKLRQKLLSTNSTILGDINNLQALIAQGQKAAENEEKEKVELEKQQRIIDERIIFPRTRQFTAIREMFTNALNYLRSWWPF